MRAIQSASKWGNLYRFRYFIDGKPVRESDFNELQLSNMKRLPMENTQFGYRLTWESPKP